MQWWIIKHYSFISGDFFKNVDSFQVLITELLHRLHADQLVNLKVDDRYAISWVCMAYEQISFSKYAIFSVCSPLLSSSIWIL